jgi:hypothetical protein
VFIRAPTGPYLDPEESSPHPHTLFILRSVLISSFHQILGPPLPSGDEGFYSSWAASAQGVHLSRKFPPLLPDDGNIQFPKRCFWKNV